MARKKGGKRTASAKKAALAEGKLQATDAIETTDTVDSPTPTDTPTETPGETPTETPGDTDTEAEREREREPEPESTGVDATHETHIRHVLSDTQSAETDTPSAPGDRVSSVLGVPSIPGVPGVPGISGGVDVSDVSQSREAQGISDSQEDRPESLGTNTEMTFETRETYTQEAQEAQDVMALDVGDGDGDLGALGAGIGGDVGGGLIGGLGEGARDIGGLKDGGDIGNLGESGDIGGDIGRVGDTDGADGDLQDVALEDVDLQEVDLSGDIAKVSLDTHAELSADPANPYSAPTQEYHTRQVTNGFSSSSIPSLDPSHSLFQLGLENLQPSVLDPPVIADSHFVSVDLDHDNSANAESTPHDTYPEDAGDIGLSAPVEPHVQTARESVTTAPEAAEESEATLDTLTLDSTRSSSPLDATLPAHPHSTDATLDMSREAPVSLLPLTSTNESPALTSPDISPSQAASSHAAPSITETPPTSVSEKASLSAVSTLRTPTHSTSPLPEDSGPSTPPRTGAGAGTEDVGSPFRSLHVQKPSTVSTLAPQDEQVVSPSDETAPFESISLEGDAAETTTEAPARTSLHSKRGSASSKKSWGGFGVDEKGQPVAHGELPVHPGPTANGNSGAGAKRSSEERTRTSSQASASGSGVSTPRRHAPPAHPHPFPIPTSPVAQTGPVPQVAMPGGVGAVAQPAHGIGARGKTAFEKIYSRTRPSHLPPKDKTEDAHHLQEWEHMMTKARELEMEKRKEEDLRRAEREKRLQQVTPQWEQLLGKVAEFSNAKVRADPALRRLWFEGVPEHLRGRAWAMAIGNPLALHKDAYQTYVKRANKALAHGRFPQDILDRVESDLDNTFPTLHIFQKGSPVRDDLRELLLAWVVMRSDEGRGYAPHINQLAAMFILAAPPSAAFLCLVNLLARPVLRGFFTEDRDEIDAFYRVFENLQADTFPKIYANCKNLGLRLPESYFRSLLVEQVPFQAACRLWDQIMLDGDGYIFRAALAIFGFLEPRLYYPDREEIQSVLEGRDAATKAIADRERERARLRGEHYEEALDGKLSVFGLSEQPLFEWLEQDGWRESRFERLVVREMPD